MLYGTSLRRCGLFSAAPCITGITATCVIYSEYDQRRELRLLAELAITIPAETYSLADALSAHYLTARYPDFAGRPGLQVNEETAKDFLQKTREVYTWLLTLKQ
ncbi:MAG: HEPN domain-containing protein [Spirochaetia bacterium]|jgi:HEPN domain-containing protein|nr:HEPN domain-containing protein [Spirochaetia bacterium]